MVGLSQAERQSIGMCRVRRLAEEK